jgi:CDGSH-type Zn-finger protein/uncharacterized Fe-S cluster protein YjdI
MNRFISPLASTGELVIMNERLREFENTFNELTTILTEREKDNTSIRPCLEQLRVAQQQMREVAARAHRLAEGLTKNTPVVSINSATSLAEVAESNHAPAVDMSESAKIAVSFEAKKCMHARHCVTQLPGVFLANTPGKWIYPEKANADELASVIRQCPSGALLYKSHTSEIHDETAPEVNILRLRENGPYALLADLEIDGEKAGVRATLCRCGKSKNKPYCDATHVAEKFRAGGEPDTIDNAELKSRGGCLKIQRLENGPLNIEGNLELCSGTGRVVLRTEGVRLCRCGNSKAKPVCDSSHIAAGFRDSVRKPNSPDADNPHAGELRL